jgi:putative ABC transport system permease protein
VWKTVLPAQDNILSSMIISAQDSSRTPFLVSSIRKLLRYRHGLGQLYPDDFAIWDQQTLLKTAQRSSNTLNRLLITLASLSMLVGGIGVMNILLVSMTERKKEIGLKMAIGATPNAILLQFLSESVFLCFFGGVLGVILGVILPPLISAATGLPYVLESAPIIWALVTTVVVGLFFGYYPAYRASHLNPVDALRETNA